MNSFDSYVLEQDTIKSIAIFYIILYAHFNIDLLTCYQRTFVNNNKFVQYIIGFFSLFFLVSLFSTTGNMAYIPPIQKLLHTVWYYILFLLTVRLDYRIMCIVIFLLILVYFIQLNITYYTRNLSSIIENNPENIQTNYYYNRYKYWITFDYPVNINLFPVTSSQISFLSYLNNILYYVILCLILFGFICYGGEIRDKFKNNKSITWINVIFDASICKMKEPKSLLYYFKMGLGLKI